jgi:tetratricopeptide (TPR) repeat protein
MTEHFERAQMLLAQERYELAAKELRQELTTNPDNPFAHSLLALCLSELKQPEQALAEARLGVSHGPHLAFSHYILAKVLSGLERSAEAARAAEEAVRLDPDDADNFALLSAIKLEQREWAAALEAAEYGIEINPEHTGCANLRAMALVKLGRKAEAGATIHATLALDPENALTHANQGWAYLHQSKPKEALEHFKAALRIDPELEWARDGMIEALKSRYLIYRWMLRYFLWMARLSEKAQWGFIIGVYFAQRLLRSTANASPELAPILWPLLILLFLFIYLTWTADSIFNLLLRLNPFGRLLLNRAQIIASNWTGGLLAATALTLGLWFLTGSTIALMAGIGCGLMVIPVASVLKCEAQPGRRVLLVYTLALAGLGLGALGVALREGTDAAWRLGGFFLLGIFVYSWVANYFSLKR